MGGGGPIAGHKFQVLLQAVCNLRKGIFFSTILSRIVDYANLNGLILLNKFSDITVRSYMNSTPPPQRPFVAFS